MELAFVSVSIHVVAFLIPFLWNALFLCWGWNNAVDVFDVHAATWTKPKSQVRRAIWPFFSHISFAYFLSENMDGFDLVLLISRVRSHHASAILGNNGYISGGVVSVFTQFSTPYSKKKKKKKRRQITRSSCSEALTPTETLLVSLMFWCDSFMYPLGHLTAVVIFVALFWWLGVSCSVLSLCGRWSIRK